MWLMYMSHDKSRDLQECDVQGNTVLERVEQMLDESKDRLEQIVKRGRSEVGIGEEGEGHIVYLLHSSCMQFLSLIASFSLDYCNRGF